MVFNNHASGYVLTCHQVNLSAGEYLNSNLKYERDTTSCGILVQAYHMENGVFTSNNFIEVIIGKGQNIRFGGVGAAHQNGVSEISINTVTYMYHTIMIHKDIRSHEGFIKTYIWPIFVDYVCWVYNRTPKESTGFFPNELCTRSKNTPHNFLLRNCPLFGAPAYVFETKKRTIL